MKIVVNAFSARRGGAQTYLINLFQHLNGSGIEKVHVFAPASLSLPSHPLLVREHTCWPVELPLLRIVWEMFVLPKRLRELQANILFTPGGLVVTRVPLRCRSVTMFRNMLPFDLAQRRKYPLLSWERPRHFVLERLLLRSMARADLVIFISEYARSVIERRLKKKLKRSVTIPHALDRHFKVADQNLPRPTWLPSQEYILYVASRFDVFKGVAEVAESFKLLKERRGGSEKLVLVGDLNTPVGERVTRNIQGWGLNDEVIRPGEIPYAELPQVYRNAKLILFASECENCPNILLESLGAGRPVLSSNVNPMPEFAGDAVLYFDPKSPLEICNQIMSIIDNPAACTALSEKARERSEPFSWQRTSAVTWNALRALCQLDARNDTLKVGDHVLTFGGAGQLESKECNR